MSVKIGINGFGRIGNLAFQAALKNKGNCNINVIKM